MISDNELSFKEMRFNPLEGLGEKSLHEVYPILANYSFISKPVNLQIKPGKDAEAVSIGKKQFDMLLRFTLMFVVREGNPVASISNWDERLKVCARTLKVDDKGVIFIVESEHEVYQRLTRFWLELCCQDIYALWFTKRCQYHNALAMLRIPLQQHDTTMVANLRHASTTITEVLEEIKKLENSLFPDERTKRSSLNTEMMYLYAEQEAKVWSSFED